MACARGTVVPCLQDLFQDQRYEAIVEAIELHKGERGERKRSLQESVVHMIRNMIHAIGNELFDFRQGTWEGVFNEQNEEGQTWQVFILESLQSGSTGAFSSGIQEIKQSIIDFNIIRANNVHEGRYEKPAGD